MVDQTVSVKIYLIDLFIFTFQQTGTATLPNLLPTILLSPTLHTICIIHHSGPDLYHKFKKHMEPLAKTGKLTLVVLGEHVNREVKRDIQEWAEKEEEGAWENLGVKTLLPVSAGPFVSFLS